MCYMMTKDSISAAVDGEDKSDPMVAFGHFLMSGQQNIIGMDRWDDNNIIKLHSIAKEIINKNSSDLKEAHALQMICKATHQQFAKISQHIIDNPKRALKYSEAGRVYSETLKRRYDQLFESMNAEESITPMEEPNEVIITGQQLNKTPKDSLSGQPMSWNDGWEKGKGQGVFKEYGNGNSLKAVSRC